MKYKFLIISLALVILGTLFLGASFQASQAISVPILTVTPNTTSTGYMYVHLGEVIKVKWNASYIPASMNCDVNYNNAGETGGVGGLQAIHEKLQGRWFDSEGYISVDSRVPSPKRIKFTCSDPADPSKTLEQYLNLGVSVGDGVSPAITVTAEPATDLRLGESTKISWSMTNLPIDGYFCSVDRDDVIGGFNSSDLDLIDKALGYGFQPLYGTFSGFQNVRITELFPYLKRIRIECSEGGWGDSISSSANITTTTTPPPLPNPYVYVTAEPKTEIDPLYAYNISWSTNDLPLNYKCWMTEEGGAGNLTGINTTLASGPTSFVTYNGSNYGGRFVGSSGARVTSSTPKWKTIKFACGPTLNSDVGATTKSISISVATPPPAATLTFSKSSNLIIGDVTKMTWNVTNVPETMRCRTNYDDISATGGITGLQAIDNKLANGTYSDYGYLTISSAVPNPKRVRLICYYTSNPSQLIIDTGINLTLSADYPTTPAGPWATLTLSKSSGLKIGDNLTATWNAYNIPAGMKCGVNYAGPIAAGISGLDSIYDKLYNQRIFSGTGNLSITSANPSTKTIRFMCGNGDLVTEPLVIDNRTNLSVLVPAVTFTTSTSLINLVPGNTINVSWQIRNMPTSASCWNNYDVTSEASDISGWPAVNTSLLAGSTSGNAVLTIGPLARGQKHLRIMCGTSPSSLLASAVISFTLPSAPIPTGVRVAAVQIAGMDVGAPPERSPWMAGATKNVAFSFSNFAPMCPGDLITCTEAQKKPVRKVAVNFRNPKTSVKARYSDVLKTVGTGSGSSNYSVGVGPMVAARIAAGDTAITPYYDGYKTQIEICPVFDDGIFPMGAFCGLSQIFTVYDKNNSFSPTYNIPAGQGCATGECVCVSGKRKICGSNMTDGTDYTGCPYSSTNYPAGTCGSVASTIAVKAIASIQGSLDGIINTFSQFFIKLFKH